MDKTNRDIIIGSGLLALLLVLWFVGKPAHATAPPPETNTADSTTPAGNSISYNMPPTLTLPPYNFGNSSPAPLPGTNAGASSGASCGCNACGTGGSGTNFGGMSSFWNDAQSGITAPVQTTVSLPTPPAIVAPPQSNFIPAGALSFNDWKFLEGFGGHLSTSNPYFNNTGFGDTIGQTSYLIKNAEVIPGRDVLKLAGDGKIYSIYTMLKGSTFGNAPAALQQQVIDAIYSTTTAS